MSASSLAPAFRHAAAERDGAHPGEHLLQIAVFHLEDVELDALELRGGVGRVRLDDHEVGPQADDHLYVRLEI